MLTAVCSSRSMMWMGWLTHGPAPPSRSQRSIATTAGPRRTIYGWASIGTLRSVAQARWGWPTFGYVDVAHAGVAGDAHQLRPRAGGNVGDRTTVKRLPAIFGATAVFALGMVSGASAAVVRSDPGIEPTPEDLWGDIQCQVDSRYEHHVTGGPDGGPWRQLTVLDGDDFYGERCELGRNTKRYGRSSATDHRGTFYLFRNGHRRIIDWYFKLMPGFPVTTQNSTIFQLKHTCPCDSITSHPEVQLMPKLPKLYLRVRSNDTNPSRWDRWSTRVGTASVAPR